MAFSRNSMKHFEKAFALKYLTYSSQISDVHWKFSSKETNTFVMLLDIAGLNGYMPFTWENFVKNWDIPLIRHFHITRKLPL